MTTKVNKNSLLNSTILKKIFSLFIFLAIVEVIFSLMSAKVSASVSQTNDRIQDLKTERSILITDSTSNYKFIQPEQPIIVTKGIDKEVASLSINSRE